VGASRVVVTASSAGAGAGMVASILRQPGSAGGSGRGCRGRLRRLRRQRQEHVARQAGASRRPSMHGRQAAAPEGSSRQEQEQALTLWLVAARSLTEKAAAPPGQAGRHDTVAALL
jgi:hypothetical protein